MLPHSARFRMLIVLYQTQGCLDIPDQTHSSFFHRLINFVACSSFHRVPTPAVSPDGVSAPTLEALLLDAYQKEFLELLGLIKVRDFSETGVIALVRSPSLTIYNTKPQDKVEPCSSTDSTVFSLRGSMSHLTCHTYNSSER